ncbi:MAG: V-type ATP synthase subunit E [Candidatus Bilamarchaeaceae archaeon]
MGLEKITSSLLKEGEDEAQKILESAKWHVSKMIEEERAKGEQLKAGVQNEVKKLLEEQRNERLAWARLEAKRIAAEAREDAIKKALDEIYELAPSLRKTEKYSSYLSKKVSAAVEEVGGKAVVHVVKGDKKLLTKIKVPVEEDLNALGGAIVESADGKMRVDLRLETLFEMRSDDIRRKLAEELF